MAHTPRASADMNVTPLIDVLLVLLIIFMAAADRLIAINKQPVGLDDLEPELRRIFATRHDKTMFLSGSGALRYGEVVQVIDAAKGAGIDRIGIVTERMRT